MTDLDFLDMVECFVVRDTEKIVARNRRQGHTALVEAGERALEDYRERFSRIRSLYQSVWPATENPKRPETNPTRP